MCCRSKHHDTPFKISSSFNLIAYQKSQRFFLRNVLTIANFMLKKTKTKTNNLIRRMSGNMNRLKSINTHIQEINSLKSNSFCINRANISYHVIFIIYSNINFTYLFFCSISGRKGPHLHKTLPFQSFLLVVNPTGSLVRQVFSTSRQAAYIHSALPTIKILTLRLLAYFLSLKLALFLLGFLLKTQKASS